MTPAVDREGIVVTGVSRSFGKVQAVQHATLRAYPGEVTALIGPNGSGKTTLMLMLASLLQPDAGSILVAGHDPVQDPAGVRAAMGWMPDLLGSWASLTVRATLEITGRLYGMDRPQAEKRASELVSLVRLEGLENQPTRVLSRGQKQRLSLARSLVHNPSVLLLDEPASGLDPAARIALRQLVRSLAAEGRTLLISSHVLAELDEMADRAVYLAAGVTASEERVQRSRSTARAWRIKSSDTQLLKATLAGIGLGEAVVDRAELLVPLAGEADAARVLGLLVAGGVPISTFAPAQGELEHTFLELNAGGA